MASRPITVKITGDYSDKDVKRAIRDLQVLQKQGVKTSNGISGVSSKMKLWGAAAVAAVGAATVKMGVDAVKAGSDLAESQSKVNVVFGESAKSVTAWSQTAVSSMGMTQQAALEAAGTYGNLFQAFGLGREQATKMSTTLVQLAADLASFNNTSVDDALIALRSGLSGETEPLKRFGIAINDARLKQEALNLGIYDGKGILNAAQKAQASYTLILKDTTLAQGDYARTAGGAANTVKTLAAGVGDLQSAFGTGFLQGFSSLGESGKSIGDMLVDLKPLFESVGEAAGHAAEGLADVAKAAANGAKEMQQPVEDQAFWAKALAMVWHIATTDLIKLTDETIRFKKLNEDSNYVANASATAAVRYRHALQGQAAAARDAGAAGLEVVDSNNQVASTALKAKSAAQKLKSALDALYGRNRDRAQLQLDLAKLRREGPDKSGERQVQKRGDDGKLMFTKAGKPIMETQRFTTKADAKQYAIDYSRTAGEYAGTFGPATQAKKLRAAQNYIAGRVDNFGVGRGYVDKLIGAPEYLTNPRPYEGYYRSGGNVTIQTMNVNVPSVAEAIEQARKAARLQGLGRGQTANAMRYAGMAAAS